MSLKSNHMNISQTKDEIISIYDMNDNYIGDDTRLNMRKKNLIHRCTTILILNERNEILRGIGGFESDIFENHCYCMNSLTAGSDQFGDEYDNHDMVCRFAYNGKGWVYSLYSSNENVDCSKIAKEYGGGGHRGAAGFKLDYCIFGEERPKKSIWQKIKDFFIH